MGIKEFENCYNERSYNGDKIRKMFYNYNTTNLFSLNEIFKINFTKYSCKGIKLKTIQWKWILKTKQTSFIFLNFTIKFWNHWPSSLIQMSCTRNSTLWWRTITFINNTINFCLLWLNHTFVFSCFEEFLNLRLITICSLKCQTHFFIIH